MTVPSLTDVFGAGATQTATTVTIAKADLPGLTAAATNNGQQILAGILLRAGIKLTPTNRTSDPDIKITIDYGGQTIFPIAGSTNLDRQDSYSVLLYKQVPRADVDPDDY